MLPNGPIKALPSLLLKESQQQDYLAKWKLYYQDYLIFFLLKSIENPFFYMISCQASAFRIFPSFEESERDKKGKMIIIKIGKDLKYSLPYCLCQRSP